VLLRHAIAIDLGRRRVRAILAAPGPKRGTLKIKRTLIEDFPADLNMDDAHAVGQWIGDRLKEARFPKANATIAIGREHVGLKRITLPTAEGAELPDMTRLAMQRELPFDADTAVIDFVPVERGNASTTVLAVAVPQPVIEFARQVGKAAGLNIERISLRTMGAAVLLNTLEPATFEYSISDLGAEAAAEETNPKSKPLTPRARGGLAIDVTGEGVEFCLVANSAIRFSRAAEVPHPQDQLAVADAVVTETRRTWMSYRIGEDSTEVAIALVMGDRRVSAYASGPLGEMLKIPVRVLEEHPRIDANGQEMDRLWPLAGLLLEPALGGELIDFAHPRKAPDLGARARRRRLIAAGIILVGAVGLWTAAKGQLSELRTRADELNKQQQALAEPYARYWRNVYKVEHLKQWESTSVDWLKHAKNLTTIAPPPEQVVLDSWTGTLDSPFVNFDRKSGKWSVNDSIIIVVEGEARDRVTADGFREALMHSPIYTTSTMGADAKGGKRMPIGFTYRLQTKVGSPVLPAPAVTAGSSSPPAKAAAADPAGVPSPAAALPPPPEAPGAASSGGGR